MTQPSSIIIRPFHNADLPRLVEIWNRTTEISGLRRPVDTLQFNQMVISKPFFVRDLFLVAVDTSVDADLPHDGKILGFAHGGFSPNSDFTGVDKSRGCVAMFIVDEQLDAALRKSLAVKLLETLEEAFRRQGTKTLTGGAIFPDAPFYIGMYLSGESPGILDDNVFAHAALKQCGYHLHQQFHIIYIDLERYEITTTRRDEHIEENYRLRITDYPVPPTWWEAAALSMLECKRCELYPNDSNFCCASVMVQKIARGGGDVMPQQVLGIHRVDVEPAYRQQGMGTFMVKQILKRFKKRLKEAEVVVPQDNENASGLFFSLEPEEVACGKVYQKRIAAE